MLDAKQARDKVIAQKKGKAMSIFHNFIENLGAEADQFDPTQMSKDDPASWRQFILALCSKEQANIYKTKGELSVNNCLRMAGIDPKTGECVNFPDFACIGGELEGLSRDALREISGYLITRRKRAQAIIDKRPKKQDKLF